MLHRFRSKSRAAGAVASTTLQITDSYCAALDDVQPRFIKQRNDVPGTNLAVGTMKVREKCPPLIGESLEINCKHASTWFQDPSDLHDCLQSCFLGQMMKHHSAEDRVELSIGKGKLLSDSIPEENLHACFLQSPLRPGKHLLRGIDTIHGTAPPHVIFRCNREGSGPAPYIQDAFDIADTRKLQQLFTKDALPAKHCEPDCQVIQSW